MGDKWWIVLVLVAQLLWVAQNYIDKWLVTPNGHDTAEDEIGTLVLISAFLSIMVVLFAPVILYVLYGANAWDKIVGMGSESIVRALGVGVIEIFWLIPYFHALHKGDEISAPPLFQSVPIFGLILGLLFFNEVPTALQIGAMAIIMLGGFVLNLQSLRQSDGKLVVHFKWSVVWLMLLSSFLIAISAFVFKDAALDANYGGTAFWMGVGAVVTGAMVSIVYPKYRGQLMRYLEMRDSKRLAVNGLNEVLNNTAALAFYGAVVLGPSTAVVQATTAYQPVLILTVGFILGKLGSQAHAVRTTGKNLAVKTAGILAIVLGSLLVI